MGRFCKLCGHQRANEQFGGKGMRRFICRKCRALPEPVFRRKWASAKLYDILKQSNISAKNIASLHAYQDIDDARFQQLLTLTLEIARVHPRKRRRYRVIAEKHPALFQRIVDSECFDELLEQFMLDNPFTSELLHEAMFRIESFRSGSSLDQPSFDATTFGEPTFDESSFDEAPFDITPVDSITIDEFNLHHSSFDDTTFGEPTFDESLFDENSFDGPTFE